MKNNNITYKDGTVYRKNDQLVAVDTSFNVIQAHTLGDFGPTQDLLTQNAVNKFILEQLSLANNATLQFTADNQYYTSTPDDLGEYAPYLSIGFVIKTSSAQGYGTTQLLANAQALSVARGKALELIALNAYLRTPNSSGMALFSGVNSQLLGS